MSEVDTKELDRLLQQAFDTASKLYQQRGFQRPVAPFVKGARAGPSRRFGRAGGVARTLVPRRRARHHAGRLGVARDAPRHGARDAGDEEDRA